MAEVSVLINVVSEEVPLLNRVISSIHGFADEIVLIDMTEGEEKYEDLIKKYDIKVYSHKLVPFVEEARNWGIMKARGNWILLLDPDEVVPQKLIGKLKKLIVSPTADYWRIPRKNIIFGKWVKGSWWPDYNIRFFKRGSVAWSNIIHSVPETKGKGADLPVKEENAIVHYNYSSLNQYLARMDRYTSVQAQELINKNYRFIWIDLLRKPMGEFFSRYFAGEGYTDGLHGLALSILQAFSETLVYLKVWENEKFLEQAITPDEVAKEFGQMQGEMSWWTNDMLIKSKNIIASLPHRVKRKLISSKK